jgi:exodeoxyribonuclease VII large subunit
MPKAVPDLFSQPLNSENTRRRVYTVSEVTQDIKIILENTFNEVWVEGEVSNFQAASSGHFYFTLKDDAALLPVVMFARANKDLKFKIENGLKAVCCGKITIYGPRGQYQIIAEKIEPKGIGSLQLALEQLKQKLEKEGLFKPQHKRPIPYFPAKIGVVTSLSTAALKDILKVLDRRFRDIQIIINPAQVQGETAKEEIAASIAELNRFNQTLPAQERIEVLIVGRGGGSIEDLWAFNEEIVARAIYNSKIPVISAVGHERDWTVADLVADLRAPTPSVAAELVIPRKEDLKDASDDLLRRLFLGMQNFLRADITDFLACRRKLALLSPSALVGLYQDKVISFTRQIAVRIEHFLRLRRTEFNAAAEKLSGLSPLNILARGYSITFKLPDNGIIKDAELLGPGDTIRTKVAKGEIFSQVTEVRKNGSG